MKHSTNMLESLRGFASTLKRTASALPPEVWAVIIILLIAVPLLD